MGRMTRREKYNWLYQHREEIYSDVEKYKNKTLVADKWEKTYNEIELALYFGGREKMISPTSLIRFKSTVYEVMEDAKLSGNQKEKEQVAEKKAIEEDKFTFVRKLDSNGAFLDMNVVEFQGPNGKYVVIQPQLVNENGYWNVKKGAMPSVNKGLHDNVETRLTEDKKTIKQLWTLAMRLYEKGQISFDK